MKTIKTAEQIKSLIISQLTPEKKLEQALYLYFNARELKKAAIKKFYPDLDEKQVNQKVKEIFLYAKS